MHRRFTTMLAAALITELSLGALLLPEGLVPMWLLPWVVLPAQPGMSLTFLLGLGGGPERLPAPTDPALHVITFLLWWAAIELVRVAWGRYRAGRTTRPIETR